MYRLAICDDEREMREQLRKMCGEILQAMGVEHCVCEFDSAEALLRTLREGVEYDLVCLDIIMDGMNGMDLAQALRRSQAEVSIVFITSSDAYLRQGYGVRPLQYLFKPVKQSELEEVLHYDISNRAPRPRLTIRQGRDTLSLPLEKIRYVESLNHNVVIHSQEETYTLRMPMREVEALLPPALFCKSHHSYFVNLAYIAQIGAKELLLSSGERIPISRRCCAQLQDRFVRYLNVPFTP